MSAHWDHAAALSRLEGDQSLLRELVAVFFEDYPQLSDRLQRAVARADYTTVRETAHSLKGSLGYIGFSYAAELAWELENASRAEDPAKTKQLASALMTEIETVRQTIAHGEQNHEAVAE